MIEKLTSILTAEGLDHLLSNFTDQGVTDAILGDLSDSDLKDLGVDKLGERKRLLAAFKRGTTTGVEAEAIVATSSVTTLASPVMSTAPTPAEATKESPFVNTLGMPFVPIPRFDTRFCVWPVRVQDYETYCMASGSPFPACPFTQDGDHPIVGVTWNEANSFCKWLTEKERAQGILDAETAYRLPTDLEWSSAVGLPHEPDATPGDRHLKLLGYPWGLRWPPPKNAGNYEHNRIDQCGHQQMINHLEKKASIYVGVEDLNPIGAEDYKKLKSEIAKIQIIQKEWFKSWSPVDDFEFTSPVGFFSANQFGIFDLGGNVWEWCEDSWSRSYSGYRVARGGSYMMPPKLKGEIIQNQKSYASSFRLGIQQPTIYQECFTDGEWVKYPDGGFRIVLARNIVQTRREDQIIHSMVKVDGGTLPEGLQHYGTAFDAFEISNVAVTLDEWNEVRKWALKNAFQIEKGWASSRKKPVTKIDVIDVLKWCNAKSAMQGLNPVYSLAGQDGYFRTGQLDGKEVKINKTANGYRLPTIAEWKWAACGGIKSEGFIYSGSNVIEEVAWFSLNSNKVAQDVGKKKPNELGIYDMSGNVREFCYLDNGEVDPLSIRRFWQTMGGCFKSSPTECSIQEDPAYPGQIIDGESGFRVARNF
jgi:formylglycine-generating enzyme required for sulfatase activity